jgi:hypothetical protein
MSEQRRNPGSHAPNPSPQTQASEVWPHGQRPEGAQRNQQTVVVEQTPFRAQDNPNGAAPETVGYVPGNVAPQAYGYVPQATPTQNQGTPQAGYTHSPPYEAPPYEAPPYEATPSFASPVPSGQAYQGPPHPVSHRRFGNTWPSEAGRHTGPMQTQRSWAVQPAPPPGVRIEGQPVNSVIPQPLANQQPAPSMRQVDTQAELSRTFALSNPEGVSTKFNPFDFPYQQSTATPTVNHPIQGQEPQPPVGPAHSQVPAHSGAKDAGQRLLKPRASQSGAESPAPLPATAPEWARAGRKMSESIEQAIRMGTASPELIRTILRASAAWHLGGHSVKSIARVAQMVDRSYQAINNSSPDAREVVRADCATLVFNALPTAIREQVSEEHVSIVLTACCSHVDRQMARTLATQRLLGWEDLALAWAIDTIESILKSDGKQGPEGKGGA